MAFGFSVGDFIAALQLVGTVINALRESGGSGAEYRELINELYGLETALLQVKQLEFEEDQRSEYIALRQAASQCQTTIDYFCARIGKYQNTLRTDGSGSIARDVFAKVQWKLCRKADLVKLKTDISAHTQSILILLSALQISKIQSLDTKVTKEYQSLGSAIHGGVNLIMAKLREQIGSGLQNGIQILENTAKILHTNILIFRMVCVIHDALNRVPKQIDRQQPVLMVDALGRTTPFFLEFIRSADALKAVLKINFENIPSGRRKIESGDFVIQDSASKRAIDLTKNWDMCFLPGQKVHMSMIFRWQKRRTNMCPNCHTTAEKKRAAIVCPACGVTFEKIIEVEDPPDGATIAPRKTLVKHHSLALQRLECSETYGDPPVTFTGATPTSAYDEEEDLRYYRLIKIVQRRRKKVWENRLNGGGNEKAESTTILDSGMVGHLTSSEDETTSPTEPTAVHDASDQNDVGTAVSKEADPSDIDKLDPIVIDHEIYEQILEMDDDDEREFSRLMMIDAFETNQRVISAISDKIDSFDIMDLRGELHYWKGYCKSYGFNKLFDLACDLHDLVHEFERDQDSSSDAQERLRECLGNAAAEAKNVETVMKSFYRIEG